jgi:hypothetical protein
MSKYVVEINEKSRKGKAFKLLLENDDSVKIIPFDKLQDTEDAILVREMRKADKSVLLSYKEAKQEIEKIKNRLAK